MSYSEAAVPVRESQVTIEFNRIGTLLENVSKEISLLEERLSTSLGAPSSKPENSLSQKSAQVKVPLASRLSDIGDKIAGFRDNLQSIRERIEL